jgi:hypothetical protein
LRDVSTRKANERITLLQGTLDLLTVVNITGLA